MNKEKKVNYFTSHILNNIFILFISSYILGGYILNEYILSAKMSLFSLDIDFIFINVVLGGFLIAALFFSVDVITETINRAVFLVLLCFSTIISSLLLPFSNGKKKKIIKEKVFQAKAKKKNGKQRSRRLAN